MHYVNLIFLYCVIDKILVCINKNNTTEWIFFITINSDKISLIPTSCVKNSSATFFWAAACLRATRAADVAAALLWAALTAAYAEEHDEQESADDDEQDSQPVWRRWQENRATENKIRQFHWTWLQLQVTDETTLQLLLQDLRQ